MNTTKPPAGIFAGIDLERVAECLRTLGHADRLRLVQALLPGELAVGVLAERCGLAQPTASTHLRLLQSRGMLASRRDGAYIHYRIANPALYDICTCIRSHFPAVR